MKDFIKKHKEIILYLIFGVLTTLVSLITYYILTMSLLDPNNVVELQISNILSWILSVLFAYFTNRRYVFNSKNKKLKEITSFFSSRLLTLFLDMLIMFLGVNVLLINDRIVKLISQIFIIISNYLLSKFIVFKKN